MLRATPVDYMHLIIDADFHQITLLLGIESRSAIDPLHHMDKLATTSYH